MHATAMKIGGLFFRNYCAPQASGRILDVGGMDVNGSLRKVKPAGWDYVAVDLAEGRGVDQVLTDPYAFPFPDNSFDAVVSTSCFEHDALFWLTFNEMCRVVKGGGYVYVNAPSAGNFHRYPVDCWRFYPDAGLALAESAIRSGHRMKLCESFIALDFEDVWNDFVSIHRKGDSTDLIRPIYELVDCENIHPGHTAELLLPSREMLYLRELKDLRQKARYAPDRSSLRNARAAAVQARPPLGG